MTILRVVIFFAGVVLFFAGANAAPRYDILKLSAVPSRLAAHSLVYSLSRAGDRLIGTGIRGHILYSDDFGDSWTQADSVPVRSSLLDTSFPTPDQGWAVGHEGIILHTADAGKTWVKQLDGVQLATIGLAYYGDKLQQDPQNKRYAFLIDEMKIAEEQGADRPFFKIMMRSPMTGIALGAYGLLFRTVDGGKSWYPVMELMDVEQLVHLFDYALLKDSPTIVLDGVHTPADIVAAGEMGTIFALDTATGQWRVQDFPYEGSMFTIVATQNQSLVTAGLRGRVFRSPDRGISWSEVNKPQTGAVVASTLLSDGRVILATQEGTLLASSDDGATFSLLPLDNPLPLSDLIEGRPGQLVLSGVFGFRVVALPPPNAVPAVSQPQDQG